MRERMSAVRSDRARGAPGGANAAAPKSARRVWRDFVDAAFVRSARKLGYNPAELWYVRDRMSKAGGHLLATAPQISNDRAAALLRQQAEDMRGTPGVTQEHLDAMLRAAEQAEKQQAPRPVPPRLAQNLNAMRQARGGLSDPAWGRIGGVAAGVGLRDLGQLPEPEFGRKLDELRDLHAQALANRNPPPG